MAFFSKLFGDPNARVIQKLQPIVAVVAASEEKYVSLTNDDLREVSVGFRERLSKGETLDDILPDAFAACREAARRTLGQRHFDSQVMGGIVLHRGQIAEMRTGEGKTLTATLPIYLNALAGKGVHVVTVNDYLARRDAVWMGQIFHALGLTTACIQHETAYRYDPTAHGKVETPEGEQADDTRDVLGGFKVEHQYLTLCTRKEAYLADITYGTNNEYGFDYLRDNLVGDVADMVQRELAYAIVDEVDSILIDEARTPLIISAQAEESAEQYYQFAKLVAQLIPHEDYNVDEKLKAATLTDQGLHKMEEWIGMGNVYTPQHVKTVHHIEQALKAHALFHRDKEYVVKEGEVIIVDEFTGRMMQGRRYSEGLHQAIEAKEGVKIQRESQTMATITFQNYFRLYRKLAGMTGTAETEAEEFFKIYKLEVVVIPTNRPNIRKDLTDRIYRSREGKYRAVVEEIKARHATGQPVLVGTISIEQNELLATLLERQGIPHQVLNAKNHEREGEIIAQAGRLGGVTIATNMAGRGVDILLGGNPPDKEEAEKVRALGGLFVLGTERHESRRIDNQLRGRAGRQGDPGASQFYISMDDDLMRVFGPDRMKGMMTTLKIPEDMPIENKSITWSIGEAQRKVETHHFDIRKHVVEYDDVINKQRETIYKKRLDILRAYATEDEALTAKTLDPQTRTLKVTILEMIDREIADVVAFHTQGEAGGDWNIKEILETMGTIFPLKPDAADVLADLAKAGGKGDKLADAEARTHVGNYFSEYAREVYGMFESQLSAQLASLGQMIDPWRAIHQLEKDLLRRAIDHIWVEHLEAIDHLRGSIGLRGYGQRDPLVEYKREAYRLFTETLSMINKQITYSIFKIGVTVQAVGPAAEEGADIVPESATYTAPAKTGDGTVEVVRDTKGTALKG